MLLSPWPVPPFQRKACRRAEAIGTYSLSEKPWNKVPLFREGFGVELFQTLHLSAIVGLPSFAVALAQA